ncbi:MAG: HAD-IA family hydrolase [Gammaproteobacteria bacterium]
MSVMIKTVLFDLDGTLADTAPDLAYALNETLKLNDKPELDYEEIRPHVSHGGIALVKLGFKMEPEHPDFETYRDQFLSIYKSNIASQTRLFVGMDELLVQLEQQNIHWGVVTNKPSWLTDPLMDALSLTQRAACIISGDTLSERKPHPAPILYACQQTGAEPHECIYVGDAQRDIEAGNRAGLTTLAALFGYIEEDDDPTLWQADAMINNPLEVLNWLNI